MTQSALLLVILTGSGAFIGALITLIVQVVTGTLHRKHERAIKTFDARLKLYVDFCVIYQELAHLHQDIMELNTAKKGVFEKIDRISDQIKCKPRPETAELERMDVHLKRFSTELGVMTNKLDLRDNALRELGARLMGTSSAIELVSNREVRQATQMVFDQLANEENPTYEVDRLTQFLQAARRDLKIVD